MNDYVISGLIGLVLSIVIIKLSGKSNVSSIKIFNDNKQFQTENSNSNKSFTDSSELDTSDGFSISYIINKLISLLLIIIMGYVINIFTDGNFVRIIVAIFPKEFEVLGLKDYFEKV
mmetsp:Transcript_18337/g.16619  ORF Transcript_18337/g.16619 Transcript_18337/m.16619 type:complete len:117 (+) Transcript_18337:1-351(+)